MNILQVEDTIKGLPDEALMQQVQQPTGQVPQYLVISEIQRRADMRKRHQEQLQEQPQGTVADQIVQEGIAGMAPPPAEMQQAMNVGPPQMDVGAPQMMYGGGIVRMQNLGQVPFYSTMRERQFLPEVTYDTMAERINLLRAKGVSDEVIESMMNRYGRDDFQRALDYIENPEEEEQGIGVLSNFPRNRNAQNWVPVNPYRAYAAGAPDSNGLEVIQNQEQVIRGGPGSLYEGDPAYPPPAPEVDLSPFRRTSDAWDWLKAKNKEIIAQRDPSQAKGIEYVTAQTPWQRAQTEGEAIVATGKVGDASVATGKVGDAITDYSLTPAENFRIIDLGGDAVAPIETGAEALLRQQKEAEALLRQQKEAEALLRQQKEGDPAYTLERILRDMKEMKGKTFESPDYSALIAASEARQKESMSDMNRLSQGLAIAQLGAGIARGDLPGGISKAAEIAGKTKKESIALRREEERVREAYNLKIAEAGSAAEKAAWTRDLSVLTGMASVLKTESISVNEQRRWHRDLLRYVEGASPGFFDDILTSVKEDDKWKEEPTQEQLKEAMRRLMALIRSEGVVSDGDVAGFAVVNPEA